MSPILFFRIFFICTGVGKIFLQINSAAVAFIDILIAAWEGLSFRTDRPGQTVQTQIRLLLEEQSDQGLHCLPFRLHRLDSLVYGKAT